MKKLAILLLSLPGIAFAESYTSFQHPELEAPKNSICKLSNNKISSCRDLSDIVSDKTITEKKPYYVFKTKHNNGRIEFSDIPRYNSEKINVTELQEKQNISISFD